MSFLKEGPFRDFPFWGRKSEPITTTVETTESKPSIVNTVFIRDSITAYLSGELQSRDPVRKTRAQTAVNFNQRYGIGG